MGVFKSIVDKANKKKDELAQKAAKQAAKTALEQSAKAALGAIDATGRAIEKALFGKEDEEGAKSADSVPKPPAPDPFAKLKAAEALKRDREKQSVKAVTASKVEADEREIDAELAALKKRLAKPE